MDANWNLIMTVGGMVLFCIVKMLRVVIKKLEQKEKHFKRIQEALRQIEEVEISKESRIPISEEKAKRIVQKVNVNLAKGERKEGNKVAVTAISARRSALSLEELTKGVIISEILGKPKGRIV